MNLNEVRANPDMNPKHTFNHELASRLNNASTLGKIGGTTNLFVSFTQLEKLGINPSPVDPETPIGVYAYPAEYVKRQLGDSLSASELPYGGKAKYANFFSLTGNVYALHRVPDNVTEQVIKVCRDVLRNDPYTWDRDFFERSVKTAAKSEAPIWTLVVKILNKDLASALNTTPTVAASKVFKVAGIDALVDYYAEIHHNEPVQVIVFNTKSIINVERVQNRKGEADLVNQKQLGGRARKAEYTPAEIEAMPVRKAAHYLLHSNPTEIGSLSPEFREKVIEQETALFRYIRKPQLTDLVAFMKADGDISLLTSKYINLIGEIGSWASQSNENIGYVDWYVNRRIRGMEEPVLLQFLTKTPGLVDRILSRYKVDRQILNAIKKYPSKFSPEIVRTAAKKR